MRPRSHRSPLWLHPWKELFDDEIETKTTEKNLAENLKKKSNLMNIFCISITFYHSLLHSLFTNLICFSSKFWELPDHCALPWKELFYDEIETKTGENLARNLKKIQILRIFSLKPNNCC